MNTKVLALSCLLAFSSAAPAAEAEADAHILGLAAAPLLAAPLAAAHIAAAPIAAAPIAAAPIAHFAAPIAYHHGPAPNCVTEDVILITQVCTPAAEEVCSTETVATHEIEYEKKCVQIVDILCDAAPVAAYHHVKREAEAEAEADPQYFGAYAGLHAAPLVADAHHLIAAPIAHVAPVAPVAHAVAHSVTATVKHACREVTTEHCVDNPKIVEVPVEVEHCHTVTKVTCAPVENKLPKTTCEAVVTTNTQHATVPVAAPIAHAAYGHAALGHIGY